MFLAINTLLTIEHAVNNAGFVKGVEHVGAISEADIDAMFATNVIGLIAMTQLLVRGQNSFTSHTQLLKPI